MTNLCHSLQDQWNHRKWTMFCSGLWFHFSGNVGHECQIFGDFAGQMSGLQAFLHRGSLSFWVLDWLRLNKTCTLSSSPGSRAAFWPFIDKKIHWFIERVVSVGSDLDLHLCETIRKYSFISFASTISAWSYLLMSFFKPAGSQLPEIRTDWQPSTVWRPHFFLCPCCQSPPLSDDSWL